jgi:hypothetical protein
MLFFMEAQLGGIKSRSFRKHTPAGCQFLTGYFSNVNYSKSIFTFQDKG